MTHMFTLRYTVGRASQLTFTQLGPALRVAIAAKFLLAPTQDEALRGRPATRDRHQPETVITLIVVGT